MRSLTPRLSIVAFVCTLLCLLAGPALAEDMTLDQVLAKHAEARGGEAAFDAVDTAKISAKMLMGAAGQQMEAPMTLYIKAPDKMRMDFVIQGTTITQAWDGELGWQVMPLMGNTEPQEMSAEESKQIKRQDLIRGMLLTYEDHGFTAEYMGVEEIEGTPAHKIKVIMDDGDIAYSYLDTEYFMEFMQEVEAVNPQTGQAGTMVISYGDFKEVGGLMMPYSMEMQPEGMAGGMNVTIENIELNTDEVTDDLFAMPEPAEVSETGDEG